MLQATAGEGPQHLLAPGIKYFFLELLDNLYGYLLNRIIIRDLLLHYYTTKKKKYKII